MKRALFAAGALVLVFVGAMEALNPNFIPPLGAMIAGVKASMPGGLAALIVLVLQTGLFLIAATLASITLGAIKRQRKIKRINAGYQRSVFGHLIHFITGNPVMPLVTIGLVIGFVMGVFGYFGENNHGTEFFVESEPEQAVVFVRQRGNLSLTEKDAAVAEVEQVILANKGIKSAFAFAGLGGLRQNDAGAGSPRDTIGRVQIELIPWEERADIPELDGNVVIAGLKAELAEIPGIRTEILELARGPAAGKPVHLRLRGEDWLNLQEAAKIVRSHFEQTAALTDIEDTLPLPGIDWQIDVDVEKAGRYGADVRTVGAMVQLVTRGILLDTMRVETSEEEIDIRVRLPQKDRLLSTLDTLRVRTRDGLVPLANFISRKPVRKLGQISRFDQRRFFDVKAALIDGMTKEVENEAGEIKDVPITANERIELLTDWLENDSPLPAGVSWEWTGDNQEQAETGAFLGKAFLGALGLMFIILLTQFNSLYNSVLVLLAVILSTTGVLIGMLVMGQPFSMIMTGTGVVALAGIVVNNNIVLIDTYQEYSEYMPKIEAIARTAQDRLRPVMLTTVTTMAGLAPMMFGLSLDFFNGGYTINSPTALWWIQLATAIVFGLGIATVLTLVFTPSMLALRVWISVGAYRSTRGLMALSMGPDSTAARDFALNRTSRKLVLPELVWNTELLDAIPAIGTTAYAGDAAVDLELGSLRKKMGRGGSTLRDKIPDGASLSSMAPKGFKPENGDDEAPDINLKPTKRKQKSPALDPAHIALDALSTAPKAKDSAADLDLTDLRKALGEADETTLDKLTPKGKKTPPRAAE